MREEPATPPRGRVSRAARRLLGSVRMDLFITFGAVAAVLLTPALVMWAHTLPRSLARER